MPFFIGDNIPVTTIPLDRSTEQESVTLIIGKNIFLKLLEDENIKLLLSDSHVQKLLETRDLAFRDFREMMNKLIYLERERERAFYDVFMLRDVMRRREKERHSRGLGTEHVKNYLNRSFRRVFLNHDKKIFGIECKLKKINPEIEILSPSILLTCPNCGAPLLRGKGREITLQGDYEGTQNCIVCETSIKGKNAKRYPIHQIIPAVRNTWVGNLWFEEYIARVMRSLEGWRTWTSIYVLGASGITHQIDFLAIKDGYVITGECKTGKVKREDVFTFWTKMADIKSHLSLLALIDEMPEPETREFISKSPSMILLEKIGNLKRDQILEKLRGSVIGKI